MVQFRLFQDRLEILATPANNVKVYGLPLGCKGRRLGLLEFSIIIVISWQWDLAVERGIEAASTSVDTAPVVVGLPSKGPWLVGPVKGVLITRGGAAPEAVLLGGIVSTASI